MSAVGTGAEVVTGLETGLETADELVSIGATSEEEPQLPPYPVGFVQPVVVAMAVVEVAVRAGLEILSAHTRPIPHTYCTISPVCDLWAAGGDRIDLGVVDGLGLLRSRQGQNGTREESSSDDTHFGGWC